ncbi:MAG: Fic family protein [Bdellovibrionales bacterium]
MDASKPNNELPLLPPKVDLENAKIFKALIKAHRELSGLKGEAKNLINSNILFSTLPLQEAKSSSEIENIITTTDQIYQALSENKNIEDIKNPQVKEVLYYREAINESLSFLKEKKYLITTNLCKKICSIIKNQEMGLRNTPGVKLWNPRTKKVVYTPPETHKLPDLLKNWEEFVNNNKNDLDPILKLAIMHYQFEAIHPFSDGNGRTGRVLNTLFLITNKLLDHPILDLSYYIHKNKSQYYKLLNNVSSKGEWIDWVLYIIKAIEVSSYETRKKIEKIRDLFNESFEKIKTEKISDKKQLIELIFINPYCRVEHFVDQDLGTRITAKKYLDLLVDKGILKPEKRGRSIIYINHKLYDLISEMD